MQVCIRYPNEGAIFLKIRTSLLLKASLILFLIISAVVVGSSLCIFGKLYDRGGHEADPPLHIHLARNW